MSSIYRSVYGSSGLIDALVSAMLALVTVTVPTHGLACTRIVCLGTGGTVDGSP